MLKEFEKEIKKTVEVYRVVKELIIYNEEVNVKLDVPAAMELRNAFDHFMRVLSSELNIDQRKNKDYIKKHLTKVRDHIARAGYDTLDWLALKTRESIIKEMSSFSLEAIKNVWPEYYKSERSKILSIAKAITYARAQKDTIDNGFENFLNYAKQIKELTNIHRKVVEKRGSLIDYDKKLKKQKIMGFVIKCVLLLIGAVIGGIVGYISALLRCV